MKKTAYPIIVLALILILGGPIPGRPALAAEMLEITDTAGRKVSVPADPKKIVCLGPGCLRLIVYLKALDKVVGVEQMERRQGGRPYYLAHSEVLDKLPVVSPGGPAAINKKPDLEAILKAGPEVLFVTYMKAGLADQVQSLLKIPVVVLTYGRLASFDEVIYSSLKIAGRILNRGERAEEVIQIIESGRADLLARVKEVEESEKPLVYVGGIGHRGAHGLESTDSLYIPFDWLKARNAAATLGEKGHLFLDKEKLLDLQPEVVFVDGGGLELIRADYEKKSGFYKALKAVKEGRVHVLFPYNWYTTNIGTALADAYAIGRLIYPKRFADVDLNQKTNAIYTDLVGRPVHDGMAEIYGPLGAKPGFMR